MANRMRFGIFLGPHHAPATQNPTTAYARDLATVQVLDQWGYDEAWIGEHHSCGVEIIPDPAMFIAWAAGQTRHIKLGTGVVSLPYHNPLWVADRMIMLDHLTRGRAMLGLGPGALPTDALMIGIDPSEQRPALDEDCDVLMHLLRNDEPISIDTKRYTLSDARCQMRPYSDPCFEVAVAAVLSPSGPRVAGKHGLGMLSVGATMRGTGGFDVLGMHWHELEKRSAEFGHVADRSRWRVVGLIHVAETREQALKDVEYGINPFFDYLQQTAATPQFTVQGETYKERVEWVNDSGIGVIGTPADAVAHIRELEEQAEGFGCFLMLAHDWAGWEATQRHYELFARYVIPQFQGSTVRLQANEKWAQTRMRELWDRQAKAIEEFSALRNGGGAGEPAATAQA